MSMPQAVDVRLVRHVSKIPTVTTPTALGGPEYGVETESSVQEIKSAVWWLSSEARHRRILSGEIHLPKDLKSTCRIGKFDLFVSITLCYLVRSFTSEFPVHYKHVYVKSGGVYSR